MAGSMFAVRRLTLEDLYRSDEYDRFIGDRLGNDLFINDPDRADRCHRAARDGADGSYHAEVIEDWRAFLDTLELPERVKDRINAEIDECEAWHDANGSLYTEIG